MKSLRKIGKGVQVMDIKIVDKSICDRIEFLWDTINNSKHISKEDKEAMIQEIHKFRRQARENGEIFPDYIAIRF